MDIQLDISNHPALLFQNKSTKLIKWLKEVVSENNITLEIPINNKIFYPITVYKDIHINGVNNLMILKSAFYFYFETEIDKKFLKTVDIKVKPKNTCWYDYIDENFRKIQSIKKLDDDEFMIVSYFHTFYSPPNPELCPKPIKKENIDVLCKKCYRMNQVPQAQIDDFTSGKHNCENCKQILLDVIKNGVY